jgi:hypothetical protein
MVALGLAHVGARLGLGDLDPASAKTSRRARTGARQPKSIIVPAQSKTTAWMALLLMR